MNYENFVRENQKIIQAIKDRVPGDDQVDMFYGTLDVATARFHTILLKLSQDRLAEQRLKNDVAECFQAIQDFYKNVQRFRFWPFFTKPFIKIVLHGIGTKRIPQIKKLLNRLEYQREFYHHGDDTV
jgi:hypothetical protein|tara:strand:+ start:2371 stop:2751 length:381 start_codon:yes stop_codon:yes gene_type:complete